jgi:CheY-like chemotaxis protein
MKRPSPPAVAAGVALVGVRMPGMDGLTFTERLALPSCSGLRVVDPAPAAESLTGGAGPLTARERDVLRQARGGGTVTEIAKP